MQGTHKPVPIPASGRLAAQLNRIPKQDLVLEVELVLIPNPVMDKVPAFFPFMLILVEKNSGYVVHFELLTPHPGVDEMVAGSGRKLLQAFVDQKIHPQEIRVRSKQLHPVLKKTLTGTSVRLNMQKYLPAADESIAGMMDFMG